MKYLFAALSEPCASSAQRQIQLGWCPVPVTPAQGGRGRNFGSSRSTIQVEPGLLEIQSQEPKERNRPPWNHLSAKLNQPFKVRWQRFCSTGTLGLGDGGQLLHS